MPCGKRTREETHESNDLRKTPIQNENGVDDDSKDPYPDHLQPTPGECLAVRDSLLDLHGFPEEFVRYRRRRNSQYEEAQEEDSCFSDSPESVLDGLVKTVLSQNTTDANSQRAFASLKSAFPTWELVLAADSKSIEIAIRCGGLAPTKASCIKNVLHCLIQRRGKLCLEYLRGLSIADIKAELSDFKGIGPKTVFQIAKAIGWVPSAANRNKTYLHLNRRIPDELKFDLNCLLFTHGKLCHECTNKGRSLQKKKNCHDGSCPLLSYCRKSI